jgi:cation diffusion facilitator CzcD-associated flavoprotein CzcO
MLDWLIVGGGIHGTYLSLFLTRRKSVPPAAVRVLDAYDSPLALWSRFSANAGMEYLRSSHAHNLHYDPFSLITFARTLSGQPLARFIEPYARPALPLFQAHSQHLIERYRLRDLRITGRARQLTRVQDGWQVETDAGSLRARRVVLAMGATEQPHWPAWALALRAAGAPVHHLFDPAFERAALPVGGRIVVVGGGITAAQSAIALAVRASGSVTLLMRHAPRIHQFDADTGWITYQHLENFHRQTDYAVRRALIREARHRGSMPADVAAELRKAEAHQLLRRHTATVQAADALPDSIRLTLDDGEHLYADHVLLATGFEPHRPGGAWLAEAITQAGLPIAADGYPIVNRNLGWSPGLFAVGPLAELEVGPVSRNFVGIKLAAERIGEML